MIAVDTSSLIVYLAGGAGRDVDLLDDAIAAKQLVLPPPVITEVLSVTGGSDEAGGLLSALPALDVTSGYCVRAGLLRSRALAAGFKARLADALIAQSCLDHKVPLFAEIGTSATSSGTACAWCRSSRRGAGGAGGQVVNKSGVSRPDPTV